MRKVADLEGAELDAWVAKAVGFEEVMIGHDELNRPAALIKGWHVYKPSSVWDEGGPIIEREGIGIEKDQYPAKNWVAWINQGREVTQYGETPLIAAMRAYVAHKFGDELPEPILL